MHIVLQFAQNGSSDANCNYDGSDEREHPTSVQGGSEALAASTMNCFSCSSYRSTANCSHNSADGTCPARRSASDEFKNVAQSAALSMTANPGPEEHTKPRTACVVARTGIPWYKLSATLMLMPAPA